MWDKNLGQQGFLGSYFRTAMKHDLTEHRAAIDTKYCLLLMWFLGSYSRTEMKHDLAKASCRHRLKSDHSSQTFKPATRPRRSRPL